MYKLSHVVSSSFFPRTEVSIAAKAHFRATHFFFPSLVTEFVATISHKLHVVILWSAADTID